jgi:hypothetical protein
MLPNSNVQARCQAGCDIKFGGLPGWLQPQLDLAHMHSDASQHVLLQACVHTHRGYTRLILSWYFSCTITLTCTLATLCVGNSYSLRGTCSQVHMNRCPMLLSSTSRAGLHLDSRKKDTALQVQATRHLVLLGGLSCC